MRRSFRLAALLGFLLMLQTFSVLSEPFFLDQWREKYPNSSSGDINCQLCHQSQLGSSPWNGYGWDIKTEFNINGRDIQLAFSHVEQINSDQDEQGRSNLQEINSNSQPGWELGLTNPVFHCLGFVCSPYSVIEYPPAVINPFPIALGTNEASFNLTKVTDGIGLIEGAVIAPNDVSKLFVFELSGKIWSLDLNSGEKSIYLDISQDIIVDEANVDLDFKQGLLGVAFHPDFASNGYLYLHTSQTASKTAHFSTLLNNEVADHQTVIVELKVSNPTALSTPALPRSSRDILIVDQPQQNNNGGGLLFDESANLYIGFGDGGSQDDQGVGHSLIGNAQDLSNPLGAILRINPLGGNYYNGRYGIPSDNPFIANDFSLNEIYAYGFRNPTKFSFDQDYNLISVDNGQDYLEEVNKVKSSGNYGWRLRVGSYYFNENDNFSGFIESSRPDDYPISPIKLRPQLSYDNDEGSHILGGYFYRGKIVSSLFGHYVFGDQNSNRLFINNAESDAIVELNLRTNIQINGIAQDSAGELYILGQEPGASSWAVFKLEADELNSELCFPINSKNEKMAIICL